MAPTRHEAGYNILNGNDAQGQAMLPNQPKHRKGTNPITGLPYDANQEPARPKTSQRRMSISSQQSSREHFDILSNKRMGSPSQAPSPAPQRRQHQHQAVPSPVAAPAPVREPVGSGEHEDSKHARIAFLKEKIAEGNFYAQSAYQAGERDEMDAIVSHLCQMEDELNALLPAAAPTQPPAAPRQAWAEEPPAPPPPQKQQQIAMQQQQRQQHQHQRGVGAAGARASRF